MNIDYFDDYTEKEIESGKQWIKINAKYQEKTDDKIFKEKYSVNNESFDDVHRRLAKIIKNDKTLKRCIKAIKNES